MRGTCAYICVLQSNENGTRPAVSTPGASAFVNVRCSKFRLPPGFRAVLGADAGAGGDAVGVGVGVGPGVGVGDDEGTGFVAGRGDGGNGDGGGGGGVSDPLGA